MSEFLIDEFIDLGAAGKQVKEVSANLDALQKKIKDFIPLRNVIENADSTKKVIQATNELAASENKLVQASNALTISQQQLATVQKSYLASLEGLQEKQFRYKSSLDAVNAAIKDYDKQLKAGTITQGQYALETERLYKNQALLKARISETNKEISAQSKLSISAPGSINAARAQNSVLAANRDRATDPARIAEINALIDRNNDLIDKNSDKLAKQKINIGNYPTVFKGAFTIVEKELEKVNQQLSSGAFKGDALQELTKKQVVLNNVTTSLSSSFTTNTAAATANRNAAKEIGLAFGANSDIFTRFNKEVAAGSKELSIVDANIKTAAKSGSAVGRVFQSLGASVVSLARLLPGIGIIGFIGLVTDAFTDWAFSIKKVVGDQKLLNDVATEGAKVAAEQAAILEIQKNQLNDVNLNNKERERIAKQYNKTAAEGNKINLEEIDNLTKINEQIDKQIALIERQSLAKAAQAQIAKFADAAVQAEFELQQALTQAGLTQDQVQKSIDQRQKRSDQILKSTQQTLDGIKINNDLAANANKQTEIVEVVDRKLQGLLVRKKTAALDLQRVINLLRPQLDGDTGTNKNAATGNTKPQKINDNTAQEILKAQFEINKLTAQQAKDSAKEILDDEKRNFDDRLQALGDYALASRAITELERQYEISVEKLKLQDTLDSLEEQKKVKGANIKGLNEQEEKERQASKFRIKAIDAKANDEAIKQYKDLLEKLKKIEQDNLKVPEVSTKGLDQVKAYFDRREKLEKEHQERLQKLREQGAQKQKDLNQQLLEEIQSTFFAFIQNGIDRENQALEERKSTIDRELELRIASIEASGLTEEQRVKKTAEANKQAAFEKEKIDKRQRELAVQRAKFEKAANIAQIIQATAAAIIETLKTYKGLPIGFAIAASIGAIGALQLAKAISTPIPKFKTGKNNDYEGLAIVDDGGQREPIYRADTGEIEMAGGPAKDRLTYLSKKDIVWPSVDAFMKSMKTPLLPQMAIIKDNAGVDNSRQLDKIVSELKDLNRKPAAKIFASQGVELSNWYDKNIRN